MKWSATITELATTPNAGARRERNAAAASPVCTAMRPDSPRVDIAKAAASAPLRPELARSLMKSPHSPRIASFVALARP